MSGDLAERYRQVSKRIADAAQAAGRDPRAITLIAVSKTQPVEAIAALYALGHRDFGENYAQELAEKAERLKEACPGIRWHFIGHLQTNKVKAVLPHAHSIHSVDSERLAAEIDKRWQQLHGTGAPPLPCFVEINVDGEDSKAGAAPDQAQALTARIASSFACIRLEGLMAIPATERTEDVARSFARLRELEARCRPATSGLLSMGMSGDYELAIREGATHVRVGTALFGARG
jgi:pyridoxal phosphate enzyme (YggS family)